MAELAEQMQGAQKVAWADNAIKLAVDMTVAGIQRLNLQGNAEQQAAEVNVFDPFTGILPENVKVKISDNAFRLRYGCPASIPKYCRGNVEIDYKPPSAPPGQAPMVLGAARFSYPAGVDGRVRIRLNGEAIALFKKTRVIKVLTVTTARDGAGTRASRTAPLTLVGPKIKKKKKPKKK